MVKSKIIYDRTRDEYRPHELGVMSSWRNTEKKEKLRRKKEDNEEKSE